MQSLQDRQYDQLSQIFGRARTTGSEDEDERIAWKERKGEEIVGKEGKGVEKGNGRGGKGK